MSGWLITPAAALPSELEAWLQSDLLPYLEKWLGRHPRLKGVPFEIVAVRDGQVVAEMDGLTRYLRQRIAERLQGVSEAHLVQSLPMPPWTYDSLHDIDCLRGHRAEAQVGVEVHPSKVGDRVRISVRALDLESHEWVRGFKKVWTGGLTESERKRLASRYADRNLIGSRQLPFQTDQPDLLASYLAEDVACTLRRSGAGPLLLSMPRDAPPYFEKVFALLAQYLDGLQEVQLTDDLGSADARLTMQVREVDGVLGQVWAHVGGGTVQQGLVRAGTRAYVALDEEALAGRERASAAAPRDEAEAGTKSDGAADGAAKRSAVSERRSSVKDTVTPALQRGGDVPPLIRAFDLIKPLQQTLCADAKPWANGYMTVHANARLPSGGCFAIRYEAGASSALYLFGQTPEGRLTRLFPNDCDALNLGKSSGRIAPGRQLHIPLFADGAPGFFLLDDRAGRERIYAVAVSDPDTEARLQGHMEHAADVCSFDEGAVERYSADALQAVLDELQKEAGGSVEWRLRSFVHATNERKTSP